MSSIDTDGAKIVQLRQIRAYHQLTKHLPTRPSPGPGFLDWDNQPDPFRRYEGSDRVELDLPELDPCPLYDAILGPDALPATPLNISSISELLYFSVAISAWKQVHGAPPWSLRVNPSSGDLHPTETYLILGPDARVDAKPTVYHYHVYGHELEARAVIPATVWAAMSKHLPPAAFLLGFTSIHWRETWKYGERAYRYCQHDLGHAIAAVCYSAAVMGWSTRVINSIQDACLAAMFGIFEQQGVEAEHPDTLLVVWPKHAQGRSDPAVPCVSDEISEVFKKLTWKGQPNTLSPETLTWSAIDDVSRVIHQESPPRLTADYGTADQSTLPQSKRLHSARAIIHQRRSAVAMDGNTTLSSASFYHMLARTMPGNEIPFSCLPWPPSVSLAIFVHRVTGLDPGLYMLVRDPTHGDALCQSLSHDFDWARPAGCPADVPLLRLRLGDAKAASQTVSCHQEIAADGVFSLGMMARFEAALAEHGAAFYTRLHWETGVIGQALYLEAEAAGIRSTGIGCFFDDAMHDILGITDTSWQSLYHFTVGGPLDDPRLQTLPPYGHLRRRSADEDTRDP